MFLHLECIDTPYPIRTSTIIKRPTSLDPERFFVVRCTLALHPHGDAPKAFVDDELHPLVHCVGIREHCPATHCGFDELQQYLGDDATFVLHL